MYQQNRKLVELIEPVVNGLSYELWGVEYLMNGKYSILRIYIDHQDGIDVDDCQKVSKQVVGVLDVEDPISGPYNLEVSSPGMDRLFFSAEQLQEYQGENVNIRLNRKHDGRRRVSGQINVVDDAHLEIICDEENLQLPWDAIDMIRLVPEY